jgi:hypothetical protein
MRGKTAGVRPALQGGGDAQRPRATAAAGFTAERLREDLPPPISKMAGAPNTALRPHYGASGDSENARQGKQTASAVASGR